ncbi:hypothetical protein [Spirosoma koreense]
MKYFFVCLTWLLAHQASAQLSVGPRGMNVTAGTSINIDGLSLTPATNLTLVNNSIQRTTTPLAGNPSISRLYQFGTSVPFSGTAAISYLPAELNGYSEYTLQLAYTGAANDPLTVTEGSTVDPTRHIVSNVLTDQNLYVVTATALSDLSPTLFARPSSVQGTKPFTVVVDVYELNSVATSGGFSVKISKDPKVNLSFDPTATTIGGKPVQNSAWSFSGPVGGYYTLTTSQSMAAGDARSVGLSGTLTPGATTGVLTVSSTVIASGFTEAAYDNNTDADKADYFQQ